MCSLKPTCITSSVFNCISCWPTLAQATPASQPITNQSPLQARSPRPTCHGERLKSLLPTLPADHDDHDAHLPSLANHLLHHLLLVQVQVQAQQGQSTPLSHQHLEVGENVTINPIFPYDQQPSCLMPTCLPTVLRSTLCLPDHLGAELKKCQKEIQIISGFHETHKQVFAIFELKRKTTI